MKKKTVIVWSVCMLFVSFAQAQPGEGTFLGQIGATSLAMGGSMLDFFPSDSFTVSLHERLPFSLKALNRVGADIVLPFKPMQVCGVYTQSGDNILLEQSFQLHLKKKLTQTIRIHVGCGLYRMETVYASTGYTVFADLTVVYLINQTLTAGCRFVNPTGTTVVMSGNKKRLEQINTIGLAYTPNQTVQLVVEGEKRPERRPFLRMGILFKAGKTCMLMGGLSTLPLSFSGGIMTSMKQTALTVGFSMHPQLGLTSSLSVTHHFHWKL